MVSILSEQMSWEKTSLIAITIGLLAIVIIEILFKVLKNRANNYVSSRAAELYRDMLPLSEECLDYSRKLYMDYDKYKSYVEMLGLNDTYNCSNQIVSNAVNNPIKYLIKYSAIERNKECLAMVDYCMDWINVYDAWLVLMKRLNDNLLEKLPGWISIFGSRDELACMVCDIPENNIRLRKPVFKFYYESPGHRSTNEFKIIVTAEVLSRVKNVLYNNVSLEGVRKAQRSLMTPDLREAIKKRDNYTCRICGNSVLKEPNLLLEVDHIIPVSKGGQTVPENLQTLCWRCNRAKGSN